MKCKKCKHFAKDAYFGWMCNRIDLNSKEAYIHEAYPQETCFIVTENFGCVLWENKLEEDEEHETK